MSIKINVLMLGLEKYQTNINVDSHLGLKGKVG